MLDIFSNFFSPCFRWVDIVRRSPSLSMMFLPMMFIVLVSTYIAIDDPEVISTWLVPSILVFLLLKHLNSPIDFSGS